ncbi:protein of unknown function [Latilactobacillus sakei]|nr:hypothetical protein LSAJ18_110057 [Latilactobacillus sakei]SON68650.1 protein of unknown function [Latilactobacillus sakei]SON72984.1 protein of unknown function [Latilactobacillus sakei]
MSVNACAPITSVFNAGSIVEITSVVEKLTVSAEPAFLLLEEPHAANNNVIATVVTPNTKPFSRLMWTLPSVVKNNHT